MSCAITIYVETIAAYPCSYNGIRGRLVNSVGRWRSLCGLTWLGALLISALGWVKGC